MFRFAANLSDCPLREQYWLSREYALAKSASAFFILGQQVVSKTTAVVGHGKVRVYRTLVLGYLDSLDDDGLSWLVTAARWHGRDCIGNILTF